MLVNLDATGTIYPNMLDYYFHEYFERRSVDIDTQYKEVPNNVYKDAFRYVRENAFPMPPGLDLSPYRPGSLCLVDYDLLLTVTRFYIECVHKYNIVSFIDTYVYFLGISESLYYKWSEYKPNDKYTLYNGLINISDPIIKYKSTDRNYFDMLNALEVDIYKTIGGLGRSTVRGKLADDRTGVVVLANNDAEIGLEYEQKRVHDRIETTARTVAELPNLFGGGMLPG